MDPFATILDLESRWRCLSDPERGVAQRLLDDAAAMIRAAKPGIDDLIDDGKLDPTLPAIVSCSMVRRAMSGPVDVLGATQHQQTAGPFSQNVTVSSPDTTLYWTRQDRRLLGVGGQRAFTVNTEPGSAQ